MPAAAPPARPNTTARFTQTVGVTATLERQPRTFVRTHGRSVRGSSPSSPGLFRLNRRLGSTQFGPEVVTLWTGRRAGQHTDRNTSVRPVANFVSGRSSVRVRPSAKDSQLNYSCPS